jgi:hypothetical protein
MDKCTAFLKTISIGKYHTVLHHRGSAFQSSIWGGMISIVLGLIIAAFAAITFTAIFK